MQEDSHGSFLNGFTIGLFAGAMGYFLFATDKGQKVRKQLNTEWEKARKELEDSGKIEKGKGTIKDILAELADKTSRFLSETKTKNNKLKIKNSKSKKTKARSSPSRTKKFKGT